jgi:DNA polymerase-1
MMAENNRLFLLDAYALIYRAYYSFIRAPRVNSKGLTTSAAYGFTNALLDIINREKPTHIAVCFDVSGPTERHEALLDYKANRQEMPEDIRSNLPYIRRIIEGFNIPIVEAEGYEADDVIGTLAKKAEAAGYQTLMVTPDKDFGQLVSENIKMYKPGKRGAPPEILGPEEICARWGLEQPEQVIDILGLMGDAVDNIPGIPGVGEKTAMKLVARFGSVEEVIKNSDQLKGKQRENVIEFAEQGMLSKQLATILLDAPVEFLPDELVMDAPDKDALLEVLSELEFRSIAKRVLGEEANLKATASDGQMDLFGESGTTIEFSDLGTLDSIAHSYTFVNDPNKLESLLAELRKQSSFCFDTETTDINERKAELVGIAFSWNKGAAYYVPFPVERTAANELIEKFRDVFQNDNMEKVAQNIKYDMVVLSNYGITLRGPLFDTMLAHYLLHPELRHGMDYLSETYLNYTPVKIETLIGKKGKNQLSMRDVDQSNISDYACEDADITWQLKELFAPKLIEDEVKQLFEEIEMPLTSVLAAMEKEGINLDADALAKFSEELGSDLKRLQDEIHSDCGVPFNIDSPKQLGEVLFDHLKLAENAKKTRTGQYKTSEDILTSLSHTHQVIPKILDYRSIKKLKSTYVDALPAAVDASTGHIHTSYMQAIAATGRLSSTDPNLQNIPIRTERGREIRKAFIPRSPEFKLLAADYSQIELRVIASMSGDKNMQEAFKEGLDIHAATAAKVFGVPVDNVDRDQRSKAKAVNFGIAYGQGAFGLSQNLGIPRAEAKEIIDGYFEQFPGVRSYMDEQIAFCKETGYVKTLCGRRRYLPDINSANNTVAAQAKRIAINAPMQGTAADIIKIAMNRIYHRIRKEKLRSRMLLQVHDELVFDVHEQEIDSMTELVRELMESALELAVPLVVDINVGKNWLEAH